MSATSRGEDQWEPCPSGEVRRMVGDMKSRRRIRKIRRVATVSVALLLIGGLGLYLVPRPGPPADGDFHFGGIACSEVRLSMPKMMAGGLDDGTMSRIQQHVSECPYCGPHCGPMLEKMKAGAMKTGQVPWHDHDGDVEIAKTTLAAR